MDEEQIKEYLELQEKPQMIINLEKATSRLQNPLYYVGGRKGRSFGRGHKRERESKERNWRKQEKQGY